jgi:hypothetical protein
VRTRCHPARGAHPRTFFLRGNDYRPIESDGHPKRLIEIEYPDLDAVERYAHSDPAVDDQAVLAAAREADLAHAADQPLGELHGIPLALKDISRARGCPPRLAPAIGWTSGNPHFGRVDNPQARQRIAGSSSGGSAPAVVAFMGPASMGNDTNGLSAFPQRCARATCGCGNWWCRCSRTTSGCRRRPGSGPRVRSEAQESMSS